MVGTWLGEYCGQVEAEEVSNSRNKIHQTTYQPLFPPLYMVKYRQLGCFEIKGIGKTDDTRTRARDAGEST